jgi:protein-L-isoaspartate(D-aspartate) O-methyltransferase
MSSSPSIRTVAAATVITAATMVGCFSSEPAQAPPMQPVPARETATAEARFAAMRQRMVDTQFRARDIVNPNVLRAMARVPRHRFIAPEWANAAYDDRPLPIGHGQTISQPYVVALMTQLVEPTANSRVLEVGTGSGYQAAVLAELCKEVYGIEIVKPLADEARARLTALGYKNVTVRHGDGYRGWKEHAPFDAILVAAAASHVPQPLVEQLAPGGRLVMPVGDYFQELLVVHKQRDGSFQRRSVIPVVFVPMTGEAERRAR